MIRGRQHEEIGFSFNKEKTNCTITTARISWQIKKEKVYGGQEESRCLAFAWQTKCVSVSRYKLETIYYTGCFKMDIMVLPTNVQCERHSSSHVTYPVDKRVPSKARSVCRLE